MENTSIYAYLLGVLVVLVVLDTIFELLLFDVNLICLMKTVIQRLVTLNLEE